MKKEKSSLDIFSTSPCISKWKGSTHILRIHFKKHGILTGFTGFTGC